NAGGTAEGADETFKTTSTPVKATVKTEPASSLAPTGATLNAGVNPNGFEVTECIFEYGTSRDRRASGRERPTPRQGTTNVADAAATNGLVENTAYRRLLVATNAGGTAEGADETFKTTSTPVKATVKTEPASSLAPTGATLNSGVNPNGFEVTECIFEYGTSSTYTKTAACTPTPGSGTTNVAVSAAISGLAENTTYHHRIVANNAGATAESADETFKTTSTPVKATVKTEPASSLAPTGATLNAGVNPNGFEVTECIFEYGTSKIGRASCRGRPTPGSGTTNVAVSAAISGRAENNTHHTRIAPNNAAETAEAAHETFKTTSTPVKATVKTEPASSLAPTGATLNAGVNPNGFEVTECIFEYGTS